MKIIEAEKLLRESKNSDELMINSAHVSHLLTKDGAKAGLKILKRTGLLRKIQELSKASEGVEVVEQGGESILKKDGRAIAPLSVMPTGYYLDEVLGLKEARFYNVYKCLLDSPDIIATLAISDSLTGR